MTDIFKSNFTLKFKAQKIEEDYDQMRNKNMRKYNITYSIINLILSITHSLVYSLTYFEIGSFLYYYIKYTTYILTGIHVICLMTTILAKNYLIHIWISRVNNFTIFMNFLAFRIYVGSVAELDFLIFSLFFTMHQVYVMAWFFTNNLHFYEGFWIYVLECLMGWGYFGVLLPPSLQFRFALMVIIIMISCLISYFYVKEKKKSFYFNYINELTIKSYSSIIQNMNSGFISIKNSKIISLNKTMFSLLNKIDKLNQNNNINEDEMIKGPNKLSGYYNLNSEKTKLLLYELFNNTAVESLENIVEDHSNFDSILNYLKNYDNNDNDRKEEFIFIGTKTYRHEQNRNSSHYYEIFGRFCDRFKQEQEENYEFIFNDVTKTKISEEINAEIKYKTIFLAKVAHEFKNPLLCVSELIDQIKDELPSKSLDNSDASDLIPTNNLIKTLSHIKSFCEYMLILVKDFDFFSIKSTGLKNTIKLDKQNVKLSRVLSYCDNITNVLIKKFQKEENIKFFIDYKEELLDGEVFTDEVRLKQLLINLLSNSVKYTYNGQIRLQIIEENDEVLFRVIDTGKGLTEDQIMRLNTNSIDNREIGEFSSGLGFSIIKELINLLDSNLYYEANGDLGSKFSFKQKLIPKKLDSGLDNLNTNKLIRVDSLASEPVTLIANLCPLTDHDIILTMLDEAKCRPRTEENFLIYKEEENSLLIPDPETDYCLLVDDETFTRKSTIRVIKNYKTNKLNSSRKIVILEASDGIECLNVFYQCMKKGIKISFIISDQTMDFMNGDICAKVLNDVTKHKNLKHIPFFILTAYENFIFNKFWIDKCYTKPLNIINIEEIFSSVFEY